MGRGPGLRWGGPPLPNQGTVGPPAFAFGPPRWTSIPNPNIAKRWANLRLNEHLRGDFRYEKRIATCVRNADTPIPKATKSMSGGSAFVSVWGVANGGRSQRYTDR